MTSSSMMNLPLDTVGQWIEAWAVQPTVWKYIQGDLSGPLSLQFKKQELS